MRGRWCAVIGLAGGVVVSGFAVAGGAQAERELVGRQPEASAGAGSVRHAEDDLRVLRRYSAEPRERAAAARRLLMNPAGEAKAILRDVLDPMAARLPTAEMDAPDAQMVVLREIAEMPSAPVWLLEPLRSLMDPAEGEAGATGVAGDAGGAVGAGGAAGISAARRQAIIAAAGSIRTRDSLRWLIDQAGRAVRSARDGGQDRPAAPVFRAMVRLSGRAEFGENLERWSLWLSQVEWISEAEWRRELAEGLAAQTDELARQRGRAVERLVGSLRAAYNATESIADRSARLAEFLRDAVPEVRALGLSLATQELANARRLEANVGTAAVELLSDESSETRRAAAELVNILAPDAESDRVVAALGVERDPRVAAVLLRAASRWPSDRVGATAVSWLEAGGVTAGPACELVDAIVRRAAEEGRGAPAVDSARTIAALRAWESMRNGDMPPAGLRLLYVLGDEADRRRVESRLRDEDPAQRWAAATALAPVEGAVEALAEAALLDPRLFQPAVQAVIKHKPDAEAYGWLARIPNVGADQRREQLATVSTLLSHADLFRVASETDDLSLRERMLSRLMSEPISTQQLLPGSRTLRPAVVAGLLLLSQTRADLGQPAGALAALDTISPGVAINGTGLVNDRFAARRVPLLLWLNRIDEAGRLSADLSAWLDGLEYCVKLPHAGRVLAAIDARFREASGEQAERLRALRAAVGVGGGAGP